jgi:hypothetical protein
MKVFMLRYPALLLSFVSFFLVSCASFSGDEARQIKFNDAVVVTNMDGKETSYKVGDTMQFPNAPVKVESQGNVSMLLIPTSTGPGTVEVKLKKIDSWGGYDFDREVNTRLNKVIEKFVSAQRALASRQGREALRIVEDLQSTNPGLTYLDFLKASAYVLNGENDRARVALESALAAFPENAAGKSLLNSLNGRVGK